MMKRVYKLTPVSQYDVVGLESWLEDMSGQGLYLKKFRPLFCTFTRGEPRRTRYRIEPHHRAYYDDLPQSMLELYREFGWDCVGEIQRSLLIFSTQDLHAPEPHTDPTLQCEQWLRLRRELRISLILSAALFVLLAALLFVGGTPLLDALTTASPAIILLVYELFLLPSAYLDLRRVTRITRQLREGVPLDHRTAYPRRRPQAVISFMTAVSLMLALVAYQWVFPFLDATGQTGISSASLSFTPLTLRTLEGRELEMNLPGARRSRYLLCPEQWSIFDVESSDSDFPGPHGLICLESERYELLIPALARPLAEELFRHSMEADLSFWWVPSQDGSGPWTTQEYQVPGTDYFAVARKGSGVFQSAVAVSGNRVALFRYVGPLDLAGHLEDLAAVVKD